jgi:hypothetical protein
MEQKEACRYEMVYDVQFRHLQGELGELKARVQRLEAAISRGVMLLVANLAGVVATLAQLLMR